MYIVYVIKSASGRRYTGHTSDLERRLIEHNSGMCRTTKGESTWKVAYTEEYATRSDAMKREKWLKSGRGRDFLESILDKTISRNNFT
ncbi:MAG: endonuclease [candidate division Zixibacteria bacterium HGW-Zixibacteria-1]|nr:MAG: endonuclease [candidate division Zixibacteria bacterium HGW-Zixibacteria-1]